MKIKLFNAVQEFRPILLFIYMAVAMTLFVSPLFNRQPLSAQNQREVDPQIVTRAEHQEIQTDIGRMEGRLDVVEGRQIDVLSKLSKLDAEVEGLTAMANRREGMLDTMMVGLGVLIIEVTIRGLTRLKEIVKRPA